MQKVENVLSRMLSRECLIENELCYRRDIALLLARRCLFMTRNKYDVSAVRFHI